MKPSTLAVVVGIIIILAGLYFFFDARSKSSETPSTTSTDQNNPPPSMNPETPSATELKIETLTPGTGVATKSGDKLTVNYTGSLTNGTVFDSSIPRGRPFTFTVGGGQVIKGWDQGLLGMKVGEKRKLTITPDLGYGAQGTPGGPIPPNATLIFEVELLKIN